MKNNHQDLSSLRLEIIEAEKAQIDFLKWKLILVAAIGAASLGIYQSNGVHKTQYLSCLIPLICAYADLCYYHLTLRILVIGAYLRSMSLKNGDSLILGYEKFANEARQHSWMKNTFAFEGIAVNVSSYIISFLVMGFGFLTNAELGFNSPTYIKWIFNQSGTYFILSGLIGLALTKSISTIFTRKQRRIDNISMENNQ